jgi:hypothetical protein
VAWNNFSSRLIMPKLCDKPMTINIKFCKENELPIRIEMGGFEGFAGTPSS